MTTIDLLLKTSEANLAVAEEAEETQSTDLFFNRYIELSKTASLLAIARCLNHIIDHGVGPTPLQVLSDEERENLSSRPKDIPPGIGTKR